MEFELAILDFRFHNYIFGRIWLGSEIYGISVEAGINASLDVQHYGIAFVGTTAAENKSNQQ